MTDVELGRWLEMLGTSKTARIKALTDMLRHANGDRMTLDDRRICCRGLRRLGAHYVPMKLLRTSVPTAGSRRMFIEDIDSE